MTSILFHREMERHSPLSLPVSSRAFRTQLRKKKSSSNGHPLLFTSASRTSSLFVLSTGNSNNSLFLPAGGADTVRSLITPCDLLLTFPDRPYPLFHRSSWPCSPIPRCRTRLRLKSTRFWDLHGFLPSMIEKIWFTWTQYSRRFTAGILWRIWVCQGLE